VPPVVPDRVLEVLIVDVTDLLGHCPRYHGAPLRRPEQIVSIRRALDIART
jgi:hypothetical protein